MAARTSFSKPALRASLEAQALAKEHGSNQVRPEHLLAAILTDPDEELREALAGLGTTPEALLAAAEQALEGPGFQPDEGLRPTPEHRQAIEQAHDEMRELGDAAIGPLHLLLALAADPETGAGRILAEASAGRKALLQEVRTQRARKRPRFLDRFRSRRRE